MCALCVPRVALVVVLFHGTAFWVISSPHNFGVLTHHVSWLLNTALMNGTMATNGLLYE